MNIMTLRNTVFVAFCMFKMVAFSQVDAPILPSIHNDSVKQIIYCGEPPLYIHPSEQQPEFEGGQITFINFIKENLRWLNREICLEGKVYVSFTITTKGELIDIEIKRGLTLEFNEEAIRVIKLTSGKWKAGKQNGKAVNVAYTIPIKFKFKLE
jgi:TonB family protein